jgi:hypothetical protein
METCVGCGSPLAPTWKFCVHCGIAVETPEPVAVAATPRTDAASGHNPGIRTRAFILGGVGIFLVGVALLVMAIAIFSGSMH